MTAWGPNCSERVRGTDAFQFRPRIARGEQLRVWISELFRCGEGGVWGWEVEGDGAGASMQREWEAAQRRAGGCGLRKCNHS